MSKHNDNVKPETSSPDTLIVYAEWQIKPVRFIIKYYQNGRIEEWLSNDHNDELFLYNKYTYPSGKSPVVKVELSQQDTRSTKANNSVHKNAKGRS